MILHPVLNSVVSLVAGILIFIFPELLNFIVAFYLILFGLLGIVARISAK